MFVYFLLTNFASYISQQIYINPMLLFSFDCFHNSYPIDFYSQNYNETMDLFNRWFISFSLILLWDEKNEQYSLASWNDSH